MICLSYNALCRSGVDYGGYWNISPKSLKLIRRPGIVELHIGVPDLQMVCSDDRVPKLYPQQLL